jgi:hypothetical protein
VSRREASGRRPTRTTRTRCSPSSSPGHSR